MYFGTCLLLLQPVQFPTDEDIVQVAHSSSGNHILALTSNGKVFGWGQGNNGVLGLNDNE